MDISTGAVIFNKRFNFCIKLGLLLFFLMLIPLIAFGQEEGYTSLTSVSQGQTVDFHISTHVPIYTLSIYRVGGTGDPLLVVNDLPGSFSSCDGGYATGCGWPVSYSITIPHDWPSGIYEAQFDTSSGSNIISFIVKENNPGSTSNILVVVPTNTYAAYNNFGGKSFYRPGRGNITPIVSYDRPTRHQRESPMLSRWVEQTGYQVEYVTDVDFHADDTLLPQYSCFITAGHSEYWSKEMRDNLDSYTDAGGNAIILSGNTSWWQVRFTEDLRKIIAYKLQYKRAGNEDPVLEDDDPTNDHLIAEYWQFPQYNTPESLTTGLSFRYAGYHNTSAGGPLVFPGHQGYGGYKVFQTDDWVFEGTNLVDGDEIGKEATIVGNEADGTHLEVRDGNGNSFLISSDDYLEYPPPGTTPYATNTEVTKTPEDFKVLGVAPAWWRGNLGHATMGYFTKPNGGTIFNAATIEWARGLEEDTNVQTITGNVINKLCGTIPITVDIQNNKQNHISITIFGSRDMDVSQLNPDDMRLFSPLGNFNYKEKKFKKTVIKDLNGDELSDLQFEIKIKQKELKDTIHSICVEGSVKEKRIYDCKSVLWKDKITGLSSKVSDFINNKFVYTSSAYLAGLSFIGLLVLRI